LHIPIAQEFPGHFYTRRDHLDFIVQPTEDFSSHGFGIQEAHQNRYRDQQRAKPTGSLEEQKKAVDAFKDVFVHAID
jgi:hypothetical protein